MDQIFQIQLAAALQINASTAAGACNLQRSPWSMVRIRRQMSHHLNELSQVGEVMRDRCAGKHVSQIELVAAADVEGLGRGAARQHYDCPGRTALHFGRTLTRVRLALPRNLKAELTSNCPSKFP